MFMQNNKVFVLYCIVFTATIPVPTLTSTTPTLTYHSYSMLPPPMLPPPILPPPSPPWGPP